MNEQLVKGEAFVRKTAQPTWNKAFQEGLDASMKNIASINAAKKQEKARANSKVANYINQLNSDIDLTSLTDSQQKAVTNYLVDERNKYAAAASRISKIDDPTSQEYLDLRDQMNGVKNAFSNLANQLNTYKEDKISYLKDFDERRISDGNKIGSLQNASKIYTDEGFMGIGAGGQLTFWDDSNSQYKNYSTIEKPFLKDFKSADNILQLNETVYNAGKALSGARKGMIYNKLKNMINSGGRDTLLSLASDDFLIDGGLNLQDPSLFEPDGQDRLQQIVLESYMNALEDSAIQGARDKRPAQGTGQGGFSGALKDEIVTSEAVINDALNFSTLSVNVPAEQREQKTKILVDQINRIDSSTDAKYMTRGQLYNQYLSVNKIKDNSENRELFTEEFGNNQIYSYDPRSLSLSQVKAIPINTDNPKDLYKFYLDNLDLSAKARNYFYGNYDNYIKNSEPADKPTETTEGGGAYDNL